MKESRERPKQDKRKNKRGSRGMREGSGRRRMMRQKGRAVRRKRG